jgi:hypothetical protein
MRSHLCPQPEQAWTLQQDRQRETSTPCSQSYVEDENIDNLPEVEWDMVIRAW